MRINKNNEKLRTVSFEIDINLYNDLETAVNNKGTSKKRLIETALKQYLKD